MEAVLPRAAAALDDWVRPPLTNSDFDFIWLTNVACFRPGGCAHYKFIGAFWDMCVDDDPVVLEACVQRFLGIIRSCGFLYDWEHLQVRLVEGLCGVGR